MTKPREQWFDDAAGPLIRPYAVTRGRTNSNWRDLDMITLVVAARWDASVERMGHEYADVVRLCGHPLSVAEVSAGLSLPLAVTKILVGDLIEAGYLIFRAPLTRGESQNHDLNLLQKVLDGVRKL
ncbi:DUF742 domain-containing protein [Actinophytocola oryzae]|uniref:Uncharacterized protein DUF742 n=1 Tax=Actinophytocola oryzae TaxID=502181 RepID=A0A4R7W653_9PSEU|nr:DUF742 domain-containing protein [Actinophytocola oryzae]TDV57628.1 uncharacterized protein DUF742 [Actinophytocola oryzae]